MADSIALGLRLGTATEHANFAGIEGEITINETDHRAVVHDGVTKGGYPMAKKSEVDGAIQTANSASSTASAAQTAANEAKNTASSAVTTANGAVTTANNAKTAAEGAVNTANTASSNASSAKTSAESAVSTANTAKSTAEGAVATANTAKSTADSALAKANKSVQKVNGVAPGTDGNVEIEIPSSVHVGASAPTDADTNVWIDIDDAGSLVVSSVNGKSADSNGEVTLNAGDVGALPSSGGKLTGAITLNTSTLVNRSGDDSNLQINGGSGWGKGASIELYGKDRTTDGGAFKVRANDGTTYKDLLVKPDGTMAFGGKNIVRSINGVNADASGNVTVTGVVAGTVIASASSSAPSGYLLCNGSAVSRTTYADLFAKIGTTYGAGDGSSTFNLPNMGTNLVSDITTGNVPVFGDGKTLGLMTAGNATFGIGGAANHVTPYSGVYGTALGTANSGSVSNGSSFGVTTDSSKSGIVAKVSATKTTIKYYIKY